MIKSLGPYRLERLLGRGGMGSVYVAVHSETGERAAVKVLSLTLADDQNFRSRFEVEIETLKQLRHPNIVQILGDGEQDGLLFYAMELVEGQNLQEALTAGEVFSWHDVVRIALEVCSALKHAHDCGVIHRDLKPANLLRTTDGTVKLTDFGIAKLFGATHQTADGSVVGTADYMSPEQADGRLVSNRTDLYSLGAVMFTLLARRTPFQGGTLAQLIHKLKFEEAPSVVRFAPQVPEALDQIIRELLRKDPQQRVATALVLSNRLRAMEHVLTAREAAEHSTNAAPTRVADQNDDSEGSHDLKLADETPETRFGPTHSDRDPPAKVDEFSWNQATVLTSTPRSPRRDAADEMDDAYAIEPPPRNRFTTIDEDQRRRSDLRKQQHDEPSAGWHSIGALGLLLAAVVVLCVWGLWPPSADTLYRRIQATIAAATPADAWKDIEQFVRRFPDDERLAEVENLRLDVECDWLESRLRLRKRKTDGVGLEPYEQEWLDAYLRRRKDPAYAQKIWQSILDTYGRQTNPPGPLQTILTATQHQLKRLHDFSLERSS